MENILSKLYSLQIKICPDVTISSIGFQKLPYVFHVLHLFCQTCHCFNHSKKQALALWESPTRGKELYFVCLFGSLSSMIPPAPLLELIFKELCDELIDSLFPTPSVLFVCSTVFCSLSLSQRLSNSKLNLRLRFPC